MIGKKLPIAFLCVQYFLLFALVTANNMDENDDNEGETKTLHFKSSVGDAVYFDPEDYASEQVFYESSVGDAVYYDPDDEVEFVHHISSVGEPLYFDHALDTPPEFLLGDAVYFSEDYSDDSQPAHPLMTPTDEINELFDEFTIEKCEAKILQESHCVNNEKFVTHQYPKQDEHGNWFCSQQNETTSCDVHSCDCDAVGDPHYRTYDGQLIHYYGVCRYTLSKLRNKDDPCYFNVEVQNEHRQPNGDVSYTAFLDIEVGNAVYRLDQQRRVTLNGQLIVVPYKDDNDVHIFFSGRLVQFVHETCGIKVSFDGRSDAFVSVSRDRFGGKMEGLCGDCNGKKDDYRTKNGDDVSEKKNRFNAIGESYRVKTVVHGESGEDEECGPAPTPPEDFCSGDWKKRILDYQYCGVISTKEGPFSECLASGKVDASQMMEICRVDICSVSSDEKRILENRCEILNALQEECSAAGFSGIVWRQKENCAFECGSNQVYDVAMNPCQDTCSSHFYGTQLTCYDLPEREGCRCMDGFLLDGELCVKPDDCQCLEKCVDTESPENCAQWVQEGQCKDYPTIMEKFCKRSCTFCIPDDKPCQDKISTDRCLEFRKQGLCSQDFHKVICGLTCNYEKCPCPSSQTNKSECHEGILTQQVLTTNFVRNENNGKCEKKEVNTVEACGDCPIIDDVDKTQCNYCTGKVEVVYTQQSRNENLECVRTVSKDVEKCAQCERNEVTSTTCENPDIVTTLRYNEVQGCDVCEERTEITRTPIVCSGEKTSESNCDPGTCLQTITNFFYDVEDCLCRISAVPYERTCCCPEGHVYRECRNGVDYEVTTTYELIDNGCVTSVTELVIEKDPSCSSLDTFIEGKCNRDTCYANDVTKNYTSDLTCSCKEIVNNYPRRCCCPESEKSEHCNVDTGVITQVTVNYELNENANTCDELRQEVHQETECSAPTKAVTDDCDYTTCLQRTTYEYQVRVACGCESTTRTEDSTCCCLEKPYTETTCRQERFVVTTDYDYNLDSNCEKLAVQESIVEVACPMDFITYGSCEDGSNQFITTTSYTVEDCKCRETETKAPLDCECGRDPTIKEYANCDPITCQKTWKQSFFTVAPNGGCQENTIQSSEPCCCLDANATLSYCDGSTGYETVVETTVLFDADLLACQAVITKSQVPYECAGETVRTSKCGSHDTYYYEEITEWEERNFQDCSCEKREKRRLVRCACPEKEDFEPTCQESTNQIEYKSVEYILTQDSTTGDLSCVPSYTYNYEPVQCDEDNTDVTQCDNRTCTYNVITTTHSVENCRCKKHRESHERKCCCSADKEEVKCHNPVIYTNIYRETLSEDESQCLKKLTVGAHEITCAQNEKVYDSECKSCEFVRTFQTFGVEDCTCKTLEEKREKRLCCCPEPESQVVCEDNVQVLRSRAYTLNDLGQCDATDYEEKSPVECDPPEVDWEACDPETGTRNYVITYHDVDDCKCVKKKSVIREVPCICPDDVDIVRSECIDNKRTVSVIVFELINDQCVEKVDREFIEPCGTFVDVEKHYCENGTHWRYESTRHIISPKTQDGIIVNEILIETTQQYTAIICQEPSTVALDCVDFLQCQETTFEQPENCTCETNTIVHDCHACNCDRKDNTVRVCAGDRFHIIEERYVPSGVECEETSTVTDELVICEPAESVGNKGSCDIKGTDGYYRNVQIITSAVENCECRRDEYVREEFCGCFPDTSVTNCVNNTNKETVEVTYALLEDSCDRIEKTTVVPTECEPISVNEGECDLATCTQVIEVNRHRIIDCSCEKETLTASRKCCAPDSKTEHACVDGFEITRTTSYVLEPTNNELFPGIPNIYEMEEVITISVESVEVMCAPFAYINELCDEETGVLHRNFTYNSKDGCSCVPKTEETLLACRCREDEEDRAEPCDSKCNQRGVKISYVLEELVCLEKREEYERKCCCEEDSITSQCDKSTGEIVTTTIRNQLTPQFTCVSATSELRSSTPCARDEVKEWATDCDPVSGKRTRQTTYYEYNKATCSCEEKVEKEEVTCSCPGPIETDKTCVDNEKWVWSIIHYVYSPDTFTCSRVESSQQAFIQCRSYPDFVGVCKPNGYKTSSITASFASDCECQEVTESREDICDCSLIPGHETKVDEKCSPNGKSIIKTTTYYILKRNKCVKQTSTVEEQITCPSDPKTQFDECRHDCNQKIKTTNLVVENCRCVRKVIDETKAKCCCPDKHLLGTVCENNEFVHSYSSYTLSQGKCIKSEENDSEPIPCAFEVEVVPECPRHGCNGVLVHREKRLVDCKCRFVEVKRQDIACCCEEDKVIDECRADGTKYRANITYTLDNYICKQSIVEEKAITNCDALTCRYEIGECEHNKREKTQYCYREDDCQCKEYKVGTEVELCGCAPEVDEKYEDCDNDCNQNIVSIVQVFDQGSKTCREVVDRTTTIKCCCSPADVSKECIGNNIFRTTVQTHTLNNGACDSNKDVTDLKLEGCDVEPSVVDVIVGECDQELGVRHITTVFSVAKNCECTNYTEVTEEICCCDCIHPPVHSTTCENDITIVQVDTVSVLTGDICRDDTTVVKHDIECTLKEWSYRLPCAPGAQETLRIFERQFAKDCQCLIEKVREVPSPCVCQPDEHVEKCDKHNNRNIVRITSYNLNEDNDQCEKSEEESTTDIDCDVGEFDSDTACDLHSNSYFKVHEKHYLHDCQCKVDVEKTLCDCVCPEDSESTVCQDNRFVTVETTYTMEDCVCKKKTHTHQRLPEVPKYEVETIGECDRDGAEGYRKVIHRTLVSHPDSCTYNIVEEEEKQLCHCEPKENVDAQCISDNLQRITTYVYADNNNNQCDWLPSTVSEVVINCPDPRTETVCDEDSGVKTITTLAYKLSQCDCLPMVTVTEARCFCRDEIKPEGEGKCNDDCQQEFTFSKLVHKDGECVREKYSEWHRCCCPDRERSRVCDDFEEVGRRYIVTETHHDLVNDSCSDRTEVTYENVNCNGELKEERNCNKETGQLTIETYEEQVDNCNCKYVRTNYEEKKCNCDPKSESSVCEWERSRFRHDVVTQSLVNDECVSNIQTTYTDVVCTAPESESDCNERTGVLTITDYQVTLNDNCECVVTPSISTRRCKCDDERKEEHECTEDGEKLHRVFDVQLTPDGVCQRTITVEILPVLCEETSWTKVEEQCVNGNRKVLNYEQKLVDCECQQTVTESDCECDCKAPPGEEVCQNGVLTIYQYEAVEDDCRCWFMGSALEEEITCPLTQTTVSECGEFSKCEKVITETSYTVDNCTCVKHVDQHTELCCCEADTVAKECDIPMGTESVITTTFSLTNGECVPSTTTTTTTTGYCQPAESRYPEGDCDEETREQKWILITRGGSGCTCSEEKIQYSRTCACQPPEVKEYSCDPTTCLKRSEVISYELNSDDQCVQSITESREDVCCCLEQSSKSTDCIDNRLITSEITVTFDEFEALCSKTQTKTDISDPCSPASEEIIGVCDILTGDVELTQINRYWEECECKVVENKEVGKCTCAEPTEETSCEDNTLLKTRRVSNTLVNRACVETEDTSTTLVTCNSAPDVTVSECDLSTCRRVETTQYEIAHNCSCSPVEEQRERICCCNDASTISFDYCDEEGHENVFVIQSEKFDENLEVCVFVETEFREKIVCDKIGREEVGPCDIPKDGQFYREVRHVFDAHVGCNCEEKTDITFELCGCGQPFEITKCEHGVENTYRHVPILLLKNDKPVCDVATEVIAQRDPLCDNKNHAYWSECNEATGKKTYTEVTYTEKNCDCESHEKTTEVLCSCPPDEIDARCHHHDTFITSVTSYVLDCSSEFSCECNPVSEDRKDVTSCPGPETKDIVCENGKVVQPLEIITYTVKDCSCANNTEVDDDEKLCQGDCTDVFDHERCQKAYKKGLCLTDPNIRSKGCRKTCGNCCDPKDIRYTAVHHKSLRTHIIKKGYFLIEQVDFDKDDDIENAEELCRQRCSGHGNCKSFEIEEISDEHKVICYVNNADPHDVSVITNKEHEVEHSEGSTLFVSHCKCPDNSELVVEDCKCTEAGPNSKKECYEVLETTYYEYNYELEKCEIHQMRERAECSDGPCRDKSPADVCEEHRQKGECRDHAVKEQCLQTCGYCDCNGREVTVGACVNNEKVITTTLYRYNEFQVCVIEEERVIEDCTPKCEKTPNEIITPGACIDGKRTIEVLRLTNEKGVCKEEVSTKEEDCDGCCPSVIVRPQPTCDSGHRSVSYEWWAKVGDCCREQRFVKKEECDGCENYEESHGDCSHGFRLALTVWQENVNGQCQERSDAQVEAC